MTLAVSPASKASVAQLRPSSPPPSQSGDSESTTTIVRYLSSTGSLGRYTAQTLPRTLLARAVEPMHSSMPPAVFESYQSSYSASHGTHSAPPTSHPASLARSGRRRHHQEPPPL